MIRKLSLNFMLSVAYVQATDVPISNDDIRKMDQADPYSKYSQRLDKNRFQVDQPVIGILTMPFWNESMKPDDFPFT